MNNKTTIPSVNFHVWQPCNMRCKFCFATFQETKNTILPKGHLPKDETIELVKQLGEYGFEKITFVGGESTLCPWLDELIITAKESGMTTMIVTNGTGLTNSFLEKNKEHLDWITLSIDSLIDETNLRTGRALIGKTVLDQTEYSDLIKKVKKYNYRLKINTVITRFNYQEDMNSFIKLATPERWKVFQVLPIQGENTMCFEDFKISERQFNEFIERHSSIKTLVKENNDDMQDTYLMIDPAGRFFTNTNNRYSLSKPILDVGIQSSLFEMDYDLKKFEKRGGLYDWS